jgi:hypothetical protein
MPCVNAVCGLSSPTVTYGCSLCTVHLHSLLSMPGPRTDEQLQATFVLVFVINTRIWRVRRACCRKRAFCS